MEEARTQREVLAFLLSKDSEWPSSSDLRARFGSSVEAAVKELAASDLVVWEGDRIVPTPAAIRFNVLRLKYQENDPPPGGSLL